ncbi:MAG: formate dehydrogenase accessory sulfurtransferase FdhD [Anaerolineae bacterium]|jgi:FdhD protein
MDGAFSWQYGRWESGHSRTIAGAVIDEGLVRIHVNGLELASFMATPIDLDLLVLGFLRSEGIIQDSQDVRLLHVCPSRTCVEVWLANGAATLPSRPILTSGCGGGVTFDDLSQRHAPVASQRRVTPQQILNGIQQLAAAATLYDETRGVHTSALSDGERLLAAAEDVGRHNTVDKLWGYCLQHGIDPAGQILLATGRISSEMLNKAAKMGVPVVASRTSPTSLSVRLAQEWNILLIGYVRGRSFNSYASQWRLIL